MTKFGKFAPGAILSTVFLAAGCGIFEGPGAQSPQQAREQTVVPTPKAASANIPLAVIATGPAAGFTSISAKNITIEGTSLKYTDFIFGNRQLPASVGGAYNITGAQAMNVVCTSGDSFSGQVTGPITHQNGAYTFKNAATGQTRAILDNAANRCDVYPVPPQAQQAAPR